MQRVRVAARLRSARVRLVHSRLHGQHLLRLLCSHSSSHDLKAQLASSKSALSLARTHTLQRLIEEHGSCSMEAAEAFDHMLEQGVADTYQLRVMMHDARNDSDAQLALMWQAEAAGVRLTMKEHSIVLKSMLMEGKDEDAIGALEDNIRARGLVWDLRMQQLIDEGVTSDRLGRMRTAELLHLLQNDATTPAGASAQAQAWSLFGRLLERGLVRSHQLVVMMVHGCSSSEAQRELLDRAQQSGAQLTAPSVNALLERLQIEGVPAADIDEAQREHLDVPPNERTRRIRERDGATLSKLRTSELKRLISTGRHDSARALLDTLLQRGAADAFQLRAMLASEIGGSADERHALLLRAEAAGVRLDASCYNLLISQLRLEGREDEAAATVEQMAARGVPTDDCTLGAQQRTHDHLARMRSGELRRLLHLGAIEQAWGLFDGLMARGLADHRHMEMMADGACADLEERQALRKRFSDQRDEQYRRRQEQEGADDD